MTDPVPETRARLVPTAGETQGDAGNLIAGIYARTSSTSQEFGYSIDEQIRRCAGRCEAMGWEVRYVFTDEAESGRNTERPAFQRMLSTAEQNALDVVVFWKLDRFCRSLVDLVKTEEQLDEWGVALQSVTEYIDTTTPVGRFNFRNLASAAELETDLTSQRVKLGMHGLAQEHRWPNDHPPLGYDLLEDKRLQVNESEAELVERIYRMYLREKSMPEVAFLLNRQGHRTKSGEEWCARSVQKVLSNELYTGVYSVAGYEDQVEDYRILPDELFNEVTETRFRFQRVEMSGERKEAKAERILEQFKDHTGGES